MRSRVPAAERGEALEAVALHRRLTTEQVGALRDVGYSLSEREPPPDRPWGPEDRSVILRLAHSRGWSAMAIAVFLQRPRATVEAVLARRKPEGLADGPPPRRRVPRLSHGPAKWGTP